MSHANHTTKIVHTHDGHISGRVSGDTFCRTIHNNHVLRVPPALAMDVSVCDQLTAWGVTRLEFRNKDTGEIFRASLSHFLEKSFEFNRGYGAQRALPLTGWILERPGGTRKPGPQDGAAPPTPKPNDKPKPPAQMGLWG